MNQHKVPTAKRNSSLYQRTEYLITYVEYRNHP